MVNNPFAPPPAPNPMGGTPAPSVQPMGQAAQQPGTGATAGRRKGFSDFLETTMTPPPTKIQTQAQTAPVAQIGPPMMGGMPGMNMGSMKPMGMPQMPQMPQMAPAMGQGLGGVPQKRPMMQRPPQPKGPPRRMADGGIVQGFAAGGGVMEQARDASGNVVPGLFRMKYDDGSYSQAADVRTVDALRRASLAGEAPTNTISESEYLEKLEPMVMANTENLSVIDVGGQNPNERLGNDMVVMTFADGTKRQTQKALYEAANELGVLDNMTSGDDFSDWHLNEWASKVGSDPAYSSAHDTFNTNQIAYNNTLMENDPTIAASRLAFVQANAGDNQAAVDAAQDLYNQYYSGDDVVSDSDTVVDGTSGGGSTAIDSVGSGSDYVVQGIPSIARLGGPGTETSEGKSLFGSNYSDLLNLDRKVLGLEDGGAVPRQTEIYGVPHELSYINAEEKALLKGLGGMGTPGPGGIPQYNFFKDAWAEITSGGKAHTETFNGGGGGRDFDADMSVGAINTGKTYSGDDPVVSGGFDFPDDNDSPSTSTSTTDYDSSSEVTPFTDPVVQKVEYDYNTGTYSYDGQSGLSGDTITAILTGDYSGVDVGVPGIDKSYTGEPSGSLVNGNVSNNTGAVWEPPGFDFDNDGISGEGNDVLDNNVSNPFDTSDPFDDDDNTPVTPTYDPSDDDYVNVDSSETTPFTSTPDSEPKPVYYDAFGNEYGSQSEATAADNAYAAAEAAAQAERERKKAERAEAKRQAELARIAEEERQKRISIALEQQKKKTEVPDVANTSYINQLMNYGMGKATQQQVFNDVANTLSSSSIANKSPEEQKRYRETLDRVAQDVYQKYTQYGMDEIAAAPDVQTLIEDTLKNDTSGADMQILNELGLVTADGDVILENDLSLVRPDEESGVNVSTDAPSVNTDTTDNDISRIVRALREGNNMVSRDFLVDQYGEDMVREAESRMLPAGVDVSGPITQQRMENQGIFGQTTYRDPNQDSAATLGPVPLSDDDMGLPSGPSSAEVPSAFPSGRSELDQYIPPDDADKEATKKALMDAVKARVSEVEGTTTDDYGTDGYSRLLGNSETQFTDKPLTEMTVSEVLALQSQRGAGSYAEYSKGINEKNGNLREDGTPAISTPAGKYQVVGSTLQRLIDAGVVNPDEKFDAETQERIGSYLIENRGLFDEDISDEQFQENLGKEFQGIDVKGYDGTISGGLKQGLGAAEKDPNAITAENYIERAGLQSSIDSGRDFGTPNAAEAQYLMKALELYDKDPSLLERILGGALSRASLGLFDPVGYDQAQATKLLGEYLKSGQFAYDTEANAIDLKDQAALEELEALSAGDGQEPGVIGVKKKDLEDITDPAERAAVEQRLDEIGYNDVIEDQSLLDDLSDTLTPDVENLQTGGNDVVIKNTKDGPEVVEPEPEPEPESEEPPFDPKTDPEVGWEVGPDGEIICNQEGYVFNEIAGICEPFVEEEEEEKPDNKTVIGGGSGDSKPTVRMPPSVASLSGSGSAESRSLGLANGGSVGLNAAADGLLRALQGAR